MVPNFPITNPSIPIQALLLCKIKVVLHIKEPAETAQNTYFSCLYSNLIINVIFPIFIVYPLHLTILSHRNETKRVSLML